MNFGFITVKNDVLFFSFFQLLYQVASATASQSYNKFPTILKPLQCGESDLGFDFQIDENEELPFQ